MLWSSTIAPLWPKGKQKNDKIVEYDVTIPYIVLITFNIAVIAPIGIWLTKRYHQTCHTYPHSARRPKLVIFYNLFAVFFVAIYIPLHILGFEILWKNNGTNAEWWESISYNSIFTAVSVSLSLRIWHSFYDFQLAHYNTRKWKSILQTDAYTDRESLLFRYKRFFGM